MLEVELVDERNLMVVIIIIVVDDDEPQMVAELGDELKLLLVKIEVFDNELMRMLILIGEVQFLDEVDDGIEVDDVAITIVDERLQL